MPLTYALDLRQAAGAPRDCTSPPVDTGAVTSFVVSAGGVALLAALASIGLPVGSGPTAARNSGRSMTTGWWRSTGRRPASAGWPRASSPPPPATAGHPAAPPDITGSVRVASGWLWSVRTRGRTDLARPRGRVAAGRVAALSLRPRHRARATACPSHRDPAGLGSPSPAGACGRRHPRHPRCRTTPREPDVQHTGSDRGVQLDVWVARASRHRRTRRGSAVSSRPAAGPGIRSSDRPASTRTSCGTPPPRSRSRPAPT